MQLPKLEKRIFTVKVDSVELKLTEPSLDQIGLLSKVSEIEESSNQEALDAISKVLVTLMDQYEESSEEKELFIKSLSPRQIMIVCDYLIEDLQPKKASEETGELPTSSQTKQAGA